MKMSSYVQMLIILITSPSWASGGTNAIVSESFTIISYTNRVKEAVFVVRGVMVDENPYNWNRDGTWSTYNIIESDSPGSPTGVVYVGYAKTSVRHEPPERAILLLVSTGIDRFYDALGKEAWRGIHEDTSDNRGRFWGGTHDEMIDRVRGTAITADEALRIALSEMIERHQEIVGRKVMAIRGAFGWTIHVWVRQPSASTFARLLFVDVRDEGYVFDVVSGGALMDMEWVLNASWSD